MLLVGDARMAFPIAKALNRAGHNVFAGVSIYSNYLEWSRHLSGSFQHASLEPGSDEGLPTILNWIDERGDIDVIQPVSEAGLRTTTRHRAAFDSRAALIAPAAETVERCSNKPAMFALCDEVGAPLAAHGAARDLPQLRELCERIGFPLIVKPATVDAPLAGRKALILQGRTALDAALDEWPEEHPDLLVQRYVRGPRHSVVFTADRGRLLGAVQVKAARTHEYDGTGYTTYGVTVAPEPQVKRAVERLVDALDYTSTGCAQFIVDPRSGETTFMELNPRVSLGRIAECAGLPHSVWGLKLALGERIEAPADPWAFRRGVRYVWTKGDLTLLKDLIADRAIGPAAATAYLGRIVADACTCHHAIFDPLDPAPAVGVYLNRWISRWRTRPVSSDVSAAVVDSVEPTGPVGA
ncbi:MAG: hypothetical protein AAF907_02180 [Planctomycetota bacterium]